MTDIVSIKKNNGSTVATISKSTPPPPTKSGDSYIKKVDFRRYKFETPVLNFRIEHNMNTTQFIETIKDEFGNRMYAELDIESPNVFNIRLTEAMKGTVDVLFGIEFTP